MNKTAALVVTYNRKDLLRQCLACLAAQTGQVPDVIVVDNASTDGTRELCASLAMENLRYYNTGKNLGGAGGFCFAVNKAMQRGYDTLWLMDDDTLPEPGALAALKRADEKLQEKFGWLSSRALATDGSDQPMNLQRRTPYREIREFDGSETPAVMASFVSLYLHSDTVRKYGLPISDFFIWSDDWEFTRRISREIPCYVVPQSRVVHAMQNPSIVNIATDTLNRRGRYHYFYRNDVYLYRREGAIGWLWLIAKDIWHSVQVLKGKTPKKAEALHIIWKGFAEGVRYSPEIPRVDTEKRE